MVIIAYYKIPIQVTGVRYIILPYILHVYFNDTDMYVGLH